MWYPTMYRNRGDCRWLEFAYVVEEQKTGLFSNLVWCGISFAEYYEGDLPKQFVIDTGVVYINRLVLDF